MAHRPDTGPLDLDLEPTSLDLPPSYSPNTEPCAEPGCVVPVARYGGEWWHDNRPDRFADAGHRPRPVPHPIDADLRGEA